jgi:hypothetical protein
MKSPFEIKNSANNNVKLATHDWTHCNNISFGIGKITPTLCELVPNKSSLSFSARTGLQFMPMVFPNQTRMFCRQSFFKVPLRTLWEDYMDYVGNYREGLVEPYHDFKGQLPKTGSLYDYLGLPTTIAGAYGNTISATPNLTRAAMLFNCARITGITQTENSANLAKKMFDWFDLNSSDFIQWIKDGNVTDLFPSSSLKFNQSNGIPLYAANCVDINVNSWRETSGDNWAGESSKNLSVAFSLPGSNSLDNASKLLALYYDENDNLFHCEYSSAIPWTLAPYNGVYNLLIAGVADGQNGVPSVARIRLCFFQDQQQYGKLGLSFSGTGQQTSCELWFGRYEYYSEQTGVRDIVYSQSPYYDSSNKDNEKQLKIAAYAARAYEAVYNCYFRDNRNRPYYIDGQVEYNKWIPTRAGGADNFKYKLHTCNWEKDAFTTAVQSPQQGIAPLVGITTYDEQSVSAEGTTTTVKKVALVDEDGRRFGVEFDSNSDGLLDVRYTELSNDIPVHKSRSLIELAQSGISINDFRNVNAYQKFLELNMRQGYSYRDIIQGRFEVKVRFDELMMPEYLGGFSEIVDMNAVTQTVQRADTGSYADQLGAMAGNAGVRKESRRISVFCDEESIILGVIYVVPVPIYTQVLPKHFLYRSLLDHFQPEFANIGFQPITYRELCPIQAYNDNKDSVYDTFGYQRPWYEYVQKLDVAHGLFRTSLKNFIMNRTFDSKPDLSDSFLLVDENQVNDVFAVTDVTDKIFGQIYFDMSAKLPIPRTTAARLG